MNTKMYLKSMLFATVALAFSACDENDDLDPKEPLNLNHEYVALLNEGSWGGNNASLAFYDATEKTITTPTLFYGLGDVANDALQATADGKIYATISNSKKLGIAEFKKSKIDGNYVTETNYVAVPLNHQPRYLAEYNGDIYISCYGGYLIRFFTSTQEQEEIKLEGGNNLEGIAIVGNTLYASNSYSVDENYTYTYNRDILTYDLKAQKQGQTLQSVVNPNYLCTIGKHLFVLGFGDYAQVPNQIAEIDTQTGMSTILAEGSKMGIWKGSLIFCDSKTDWSTNTTNNTFYTYNPESGKTNVVDTSNWPAELSSTAIYTIQGTPKTDDLYIATTDYITTSTVYRIGKDGKLKDSFDSDGINCNTVIPLKQ